MTVVDGDVLRVVVSITAPDSVLCQNVFHYRLNDPAADNPTDAQVLSCIDLEISAIYSLWDDEMASDYTVDTADVDKVEWNAGEAIWEVVEHIGSLLIDIDGLGISDACPHGCAANLTFDTVDPKRRGRKFLPGIAEDGVQDSTFIGAVQTVLAAIIAEMLTDRIVTGSASMVAGIPTNLGTWLPFVLGVANVISAYQRRRKPGVGV